jgi:hypothetical protein
VITSSFTFLASASCAIHPEQGARLQREGLVDAEALITHTFGFGQAAATMKGIVVASLQAIKAVDDSGRLRWA